MGWDIDVACEYYHPINKQWTIADDYTEYHSATDPDNVVIDIVEPIAEYRNYNLFRPLANIRNTQQTIDNELKMWNDYTTTHGRSYYQPSAVADLITETKHPTEVVPAIKGIPEDVSVPAKSIYRYSQGNDYYITLDQLAKFCLMHCELHQLRKFMEAANTKYLNVVQALKAKYPEAPQLSKADFRILYTLNC